MEFRHLQTGQAIRFLPPDSGIGKLVKVAVSEYIRYFNALKQGALPQPQTTKEQVTQVAAAAIQRSMAMRQTTMTLVGVGRENTIPDSQLTGLLMEYAQISGGMGFELGAAGAADMDMQGESTAAALSGSTPSKTIRWNIQTNSVTSPAAPLMLPPEV